MKLNNLTKALVVALALLGVVPVQAKSEIYVTENDNAPIEIVEQVPANEPIEYEVVEHVVPRKSYRARTGRQHYKTYYVKESNPVTMGDVANTVVYTAGVGTLAYVTLGLISSVIIGTAAAVATVLA